MTVLLLSPSLAIELLEKAAVVLRDVSMTIPFPAVLSGSLCAFLLAEKRVPPFVKNEMPVTIERCCPVKLFYLIEVFSFSMVGRGERTATKPVVCTEHHYKTPNADDDLLRHSRDRIGKKMLGFDWESPLEFVYEHSNSRTPYQL